ncbi:gamma-soluble NSF attachment protein-like [Hetaerina americana]|uniref:gamma-soluble NSF attachment protein-like n=1 Tax=Hetaerina americana TaxID=62018 RepID=UPI003A7F40E3
MANNKKIDEGLEHIRVAEKSLKTSLLKWRPDYEIASDEFSKAATCFKNAKSFEQCKECLLRAADCHKQNKSWFHAAKCMEQAVLACKDLGDLRDVQSLAQRAAYLFQQHGSPESAAQVLDKAGKLLEAQYADQALRLYQQAADVVMIEDNPKHAAEFCSKVARIMVKLQMYDQAADALRREIGLQQQCECTAAVGRLAVALVLVQLAREDTVAAEKAFKEWGNYCDPEEVQTLEMLLQGFDEEDGDMVSRALHSPFIRHMDVEYSRLARDLPLPKGIVLPKPAKDGSTASPSTSQRDEPVPTLSSLLKAPVRENATSSYVSPNAPPAGDGASSLAKEFDATEEKRPEPTSGADANEEEDEDDLH